MNITDRLNTIENGWTPKIVEEQIFKKVYEDGTIQYRNAKGELHNIDGKPAIIHPNGIEEYWINGKKKIRYEYH